MLGSMDNNDYWFIALTFHQNQHTVDFDLEFYS